MSYKPGELTKDELRQESKEYYEWVKKRGKRNCPKCGSDRCCDSCLAAKGGKCSCACGGKYHGIGSDQLFLRLIPLVRL